VSLPLRYPYPPMEAATADALPAGRDWQYEPKWDGFRCLAFRDGDTVRIQSKAGSPWVGSRSNPSWWSRWGTTTSPASASGTAREFLRWRPDKDPRQCRMSQLL
jgi:ATP-dependent DNA ligase